MGEIGGNTRGVDDIKQPELKYMIILDHIVSTPAYLSHERVSFQEKRERLTDTALKKPQHKPSKQHDP